MNAKIYLLTFIAYAVFTLTRQPFILSKSYITELNSIQLGLIDTNFLLFYTIGSIINGRIGDLIDNRRLLIFGMILSGICCMLLGLALHSFIYLFILNGITGFFQSSGWPAVLGLIGNEISGFKMGIWNIHGAIGVIVGKIMISSLFESIGLQNTFFVTGIICILTGIIQYIFIPEQNTNIQEDIKNVSIDIIEIFKRIPELTIYCICFFCVKFSAYCLMLWLPLYINNLNYTPYEANLISTTYDIGSIVSSISTGYIYDKFPKPAIICGSNLLISIPLLFIYSYCKDISIVLQLILIFTIGITMNVAYLLITGKISTELASRIPDSSSEIIGILNAAGSAGATLQGVTIGFISSSNWNFTFYTLIVCCILSISSISGLIIGEIKLIKNGNINQVKNDVN